MTEMDVMAEIQYNIDEQATNIWLKRRMNNMYVCCWNSMNGNPECWIKGETKEVLVKYMEDLNVKEYFIGLDDVSAEKAEWRIKSLEERINKVKQFVAEV